MSKDKKFDIEELFYNISMENTTIDSCYTGKQPKYEKEDKSDKECKQDKYDKCDKYEKEDKCNKEVKWDKDKKDCKTDYSKDKDIYLEPCELCKTIKAEEVNVEKNGIRLLTVKIKVNKVCFDKKVAIACIIYDKCHRIVALKGFTTMLCKEYECGRDACGTIERKLVFVIPDHDICDPLELDVRVLANYIYPCEPKC